jgi:hypothetical protein
LLRWDGSDLFEHGLPRVYRGKRVEIEPAISPGIPAGYPYRYSPMMPPEPGCPGYYALKNKAPDPRRDAAVCLPHMEEWARLHPKDWDKRVPPYFRQIVEWQRAVKHHALIGSWQERTPNEHDPTPAHVLIRVTRWDGTDLFSLGLPPAYQGKPVRILNDPGAIVSVDPKSDPMLRPGCPGALS